jgi:tRNA nucleotidyltransferase (CCA-adding enzyme)
VKTMKIYLVGGAVRDSLLGLPHQEKDWVVIGSTPEQMIELGYRPVGKDFPVFLHPETHEEYALARTERKTGKGYTQFVFHASPDVTLEEDLKRRDLTINAIAMTDDGKLIDPYHGEQDVQHKILRHVSEAFIEDPVRILRVGRFLARFYHLGFSIAPETQELMKKMVSNGEVDALVPDRVWQETDKALSKQNPEKFFEVLFNCGAFEKLFFNLILPKSFSVHKNSQRFASLFLESSVTDIEKFCKKYPVPVYYRELALLANKYKNSNITEYSPEEIIILLEKLDAYRRPERFYDWLEISQSKELKGFFEQSKLINTESLIKQGLTGKKLGEAIHKARVEKIEKVSVMGGKNA